MKKFILAILFVLNSVITNAQDAQVEMADALRANGKIYVVVVVLALVFTGIIVYLVNLDSKITKIEKRLNSKN